MLNQIYLLQRRLTPEQCIRLVLGEDWSITIDVDDVLDSAPEDDACLVINKPNGNVILVNVAQIRFANASRKGAWI